MSAETSLRLMGAVAATLLATCWQPIGANAEDMISSDASEILHSMSDYLGGLKAFSAAYEADTEIITDAGQKIQLTASGDITIRRPDGAHIERMGQLSRAEIFYDGKTLSLYGKNANAYLQIPSAHGLDAAIEDFRLDTGFTAPGADLLVDHPYDTLMDGTTSGAYVGDSYIDGIPCYQLAFRKQDVDWQIWVRADEHPVPMKYVITTKWMTGAPQYSLRLYNWDFHPAINDAAFKFTPPQGAKKLDHLMVNESGEIVLGEH